MKFAARATCAVGISLIVTNAAPFIGFLYGWRGVTMLLGFLSLAALWLGSIASADDSSRRKVALCCTVGLLPLALGIGAWVIEPNDPMGPALVVSGVTLSVAIVTGTFLPRDKNAI